MGRFSEMRIASVQIKGDQLHIGVDRSPVGTMNTEQKTSVNISIQADFFGFQTTQTATCQCSELSYDGLEVNRAGYKAELMFDIECLERGIDTYIPVVQSSRVDRVTISGQYVYRVQIKHPGKSNGNGVRIIELINRNKRHDLDKEKVERGFDSQSCDLFAVLPKGQLGQWYIIPAEELDGCRATSIGARFDVFRNAWELISTPKELWQKTIALSKP